MDAKVPMHAFAAIQHGFRLGFYLVVNPEEDGVNASRGERGVGVGVQDLVGWGCGGWFASEGVVRREGEGEAWDGGVVEVTAVGGLRYDGVRTGR